MIEWYGSGRRWWLPAAVGLFYSVCQPPFNHETHFLLSFFPFLSFVLLVPFFAFAVAGSPRRAALQTYTFGVVASLSQFYWLANVMVDGLWVLIIAGMFFLALFLGLFFVLHGLVFRWLFEKRPGFLVVVFPAYWVVFEYLRTLGEMSFPWALTGYALTPILSVAQLASITGVYGLSFLVVAGNVVVWRALCRIRHGASICRDGKPVLFGVLVVCLLSAWGSRRIARHRMTPSVRIALVQNNIDQTHWGPGSLDTAMDVTEALIHRVVPGESDLVVLPESGVFCYLERKWRRLRRVMAWSDSVRSAMLIGTLHFEREARTRGRTYSVYNAVLFLDSAGAQFQRYYKMRLVPFSEALPFEGIFPVLSRVNLGEADFERGTQESIFAFGDGVRAAPFVCYEIIYPSFVRRRVRAGANLLVNMTNDGWFGRSTGPYQQAAMARMRSIENGVSLARCANSGISQFVDPVGRVLGRSGLYERTVLSAELPIQVVGTVYGVLGDWVVLACALVLAAVVTRELANRWTRATRASVSG